jgi:lipoprotein-anchoring transpeptidase ErfK/SrfK
MKELLRLTLSRAALLPLSLLALSCGGGSSRPPQKDPPQATLSVVKANVAGPKITVMVGATGCDVIQSLQIYDADDLLKSVPYSGPGTVPVDLAANEVKYTRGIAVQMSLKARVTCTDGRTNDSQPQPATFFPAAEVIDPPATGGQVVTDNFVTEGTLPLIYFIGCGNEAGGIPKLYKVEKNNTSSQAPQSVDLPFLCTSSTVITPKNPTSGKRWLWTPNAGAIAFDSNLNITGRVNAPIDLLIVGPDGDAIVYDAGSGGSIVGVARVSHVNGGIKWAYTPRGFVINAPAARGPDVLVATITANGAPSNRANILVSRVDYATGGELGALVIQEVASDNPFPTTAPPSVFSPDGSLMYMAFSGLGGITQVFACLTNGPGCTGTTQRWTTPPRLTAPIVALVPYAGGSRVAAIAPQKVWFLDAATGAVTNKGGVEGALSPEGGLVVLQVQSGAPPYAQGFYLLNGPPPQEGLPAPQPLEIVATDDPAKGELYRYQINAGSLAVAIDDNGTLWMRAGGSLVRPLSMADYRQVRPVTP